MLKVIYDSDYEGHHAEHLEHLIRWIQQNKKHEIQNYLFVITREIYRKLVDRIENILVNIEFIPSDTYQKIAAEASPLKRSKHELRYLERLASEKNITEILFMILDRYQYIIGSKKFKRLNLKVSGILFNPYPRIPFLGTTLSETVKKVVKKGKKIILNFWMIRNKNIEAIFILDDKYTVDYLSRVFSDQKEVFKVLREPIPESSVKNMGEQDNSGENEVIKLLAFGVVNYRKNLLNIIEAAKRATTVRERKIELLIYGKCVNKYYLNALKRKIELSETENDNFNIIFKNRFVTEEEKERLYTEASVVLAIYLDFYSSSGVLSHSVRFGKPLIVSKKGLMGTLTEEYQLGETAISTSVNSIMDSIIKIQESNKDYTVHHEEFLRERTPQNFASTLLEN
ncbi:MAG: hypothetical protein FH748_09200 [Balneolaceae bacterium]|nr:hypothetical protein [Balneolaceae bacterium]